MNNAHRGYRGIPTRNTQQWTKVPLSETFILGYAFKQTGKGIDKTELLIFLTPRIIKESITAVR